jgi:hypothetical protein
LQISLSSTMDDWNRCGCETAMAEEKDCYSTVSMLARRRRLQRGRRTNGGSERND